MKAIIFVLVLISTSTYAQEAKWWKGNTHTHSWWSDGDSPPELIADWYKNNDYHFLVLSDHNIMQEGGKWYSISKPIRRPEQIKNAYKAYKKRFGDSWVEERKINGELSVKLKTLDEFRSLFEEPNRFIFIKGEEITDRYMEHPVHMNGVNLVEMVKPQGGNSVTHTMQNTINAVREQSERYDQPMLVHLNHPNFYYAQTAEDFFYLDTKKDEGFFEMYNGHSGVENYGDDHHQSTERIWDIVLSKRLGELNKEIIYGLATDDAHEYTKWGVGVTNPGRGWVMVKSPWLTPNQITAALKRGDYYNSTGVELSTLDMGKKSMTVEVKAQPGVEYEIEFIGTLKGTDLSATSHTHDHKHAHTRFSHHGKEEIKKYSPEIGKVLKTVSGAKAKYTYTGDEIYVRARIHSTKPHPNPFAEGDMEMAWTQPVVVAKK